MATPEYTEDQIAFIKEKFVSSTDIVKNLYVNVLNEEQLLRIYGLYKVATIGHCNVLEPSGGLLGSFVESKETKKYKSWKKVAEELDGNTTMGMIRYIEFVDELIDNA